MKKPVKLKSAFVLRNGVLVPIQGQFIKVNREEAKSKTQSVNEIGSEIVKKKAG